MPKLGSASLREASRSVVLRAEGVARRQPHRGREQRDNGIKHHIVQILRVRHPRMPRNATIWLVLWHSRPRHHHWGSFRDRPRPSLLKRTWREHGGTDLTKRETNLSREFLASANYTEKGQSLLTPTVLYAVHVLCCHNQVVK